MERAPPLLFVLLCAAFFTAAAASASIFPPFLAHDGGASAATAAQGAKPLKEKGKVLSKYVAKLRPPKKDGKVIGDKSASGKLIYKLVTVFKIDSGGKKPASGNLPSCTGSGVFGVTALPWVNVTSAQAGKRYSFKLKMPVRYKTLAEARTALQGVTAGGDYYMIGHDNNAFALCGKINKVK